MNDQDLWWLAGLLEGEGSFMPGPPSEPNQPKIVVQMTDEDIIARVSDLFQVTYWSHTPKNLRWKKSFSTHIRGIRAVNVMMLLRPMMGSRRQRQIDAAISSYNPNYGRKVTPEQVAEIKFRFENGKERATDLALEFGITKWHVYAIHQDRVRSKL